MKTVFCLALLAVCLVLATAEKCTQLRDCDHITCDNGHALTCTRNTCTCTDGNQGSCLGKDDCSGSCRSGWHCVDSKCRCGGFGK